MEGDDVVLEPSPGVSMRFMRRAVMDVIAEDGEGDGGEAEAPAADGAADEAPAAGTDEAQTAGTGAAGKPGEDGQSAG